MLDEGGEFQVPGRRNSMCKGPEVGMSSPVRKADTVPGLIGLTVQGLHCPV